MPSPPPRPALYAVALVACALAAAATAQTFDDIGPAIGFNAAASSQSVHIGGGVSMVDLEGDGDLDLVYTQPGGSAGVAWQQSDGSWLRQPNVLTPDTPPGNVLGHVPADVDGDGDVDVLVLRTGTPALLRNDGGIFVDVSATHLPAAVVPGPSGAAGDVDADGDVDFYLGGYLQGTTFPWHRCAVNVLLLGDGTGHFIDRAATLGVDDAGCALATAMVDIDDDGDLDLVTVNDFAMFVGPSRIFRNEGLDESTGEPRFTEIAGALPTPVYGMGVAFDDLDDDGRLDVMTSSIGRPAAFLRTADGGFVDRTESLGLAVRHGRSGLQVTWGLAFEDLDHDGLLDAVAAGGHIPAALFLESPTNASNVLWAGRPDGGFEVDPSGWSLPEGGQYVGRGLSRGDLDGDGRTDLAIAHAGLRISVYRNASPGIPTLRVRPRARYTATVDGSRLRVACGGAVKTRQLVTSGAFGGAHAPEVTVSFPPASCPLGSALDVWIRFPSGYTLRTTAAAGDRMGPVEPAWFTVATDSAGLVATVAPTGEDGGSLLSGITILGASGPTTSDAGVHSAPVASSATTLGIQVGEARWPVVRRLSPGPVPVVEALPASPRSRRPVTYRVSPSGEASPPVDQLDIDGVLYPTTPLPEGGAKVSLPDAGDPGVRVVRAISAGEVVGTVSLEVKDAVSPAHTRVTIDSASVAGLLGKAKVRIEPCDEAGRCELPTTLVAFRVGGTPVAAATQALSGAIEATVDVAGQAGALLEVTVAGTTVASATLREGLGGPAMAALVSPATSRCAFSQGAAWADGYDRATLLFDLRASDGQRLAVPATWLDFPATGLAQVPGSVILANYYGGASFITGTDVGVGVVTPRVHGVPVGLTCSIPIVSPPPPRFAPETSTLTAAPAQLAPGESAGVQFVPRTASKRLVGSALGAVVTSSLGTVSAPLTYDGKGAYTTVISHDGEPGLATVAARVDDGEIPAWVSSTLTLLDDVPSDADAGGSPPDAAEPDAVENADAGADEPDAHEPDTVEPSPVEPDTDDDTGMADTVDDTLDDAVTPPDVPGAEPMDTQGASDAPQQGDLLSGDVPAGPDAGDDGDARGGDDMDTPLRPDGPEDSGASDTRDDAEGDAGSLPESDVASSTDVFDHSEGADVSSLPASMAGDGGCATTSGPGAWGGAFTLCLLWLWASLARRRAFHE